MTDEANSENGLPPKLDLRGKGIIVPGETPSRPASPLEPVSSSSSGDSGNHGSAFSSQYASGTIRIKIPAEDNKDETPTSDQSKPLTPRPVASAPSALTTKPPSPFTQAAVKPSPTTPLVPKPSNEGKETVTPVDPKPSTLAAAPGPRPVIRSVSGPKTIKIKKPVSVGIKRETANLNAESGAKSSTSKISLPGNIGRPSDPVPSGTETIRIAPSQTGQIPGTVKSGDHEGTAQTPDLKRQTSRISLESVLGGQDESSPSSSPKTIKLKRPELAAPTVKMKAPEAVVPTVKMRAPEEISAKTEEEDKPDGEKKTIKVKRTSVKMSVQASSSAGSGDDEARDTPTMFVPPVPVEDGEDTANWTFIFSAVAAMLVSFVLIYVLLAQVIGPNVSLTELSYGAHETVLDWPGRIE